MVALLKDLTLPCLLFTAVCLRPLLPPQHIWCAQFSPCQIIILRIHRHFHCYYGLCLFPTSTISITMFSSIPTVCIPLCHSFPHLCPIATTPSFPTSITSIVQPLFLKEKMTDSLPLLHFPVLLAKLSRCVPFSVWIKCELVCMFFEIPPLYLQNVLFVKTKKVIAERGSY